ncbi:F-box domain-containing protein [Orpheovirus IHUMI-LCC2]|uniref:F-box domain-containing protein n=1 Tax=Orpheovirus IHUMI-LCC2 TaxID=2023057 RepID=A0A2I2L4K3_9VIRU|nr:F-box domain-containing protein [Orpheovirus IHUMI-LCC2]SNW62430.1 F-box domain-containing protein [Orpheovirus IHUMI-LCC2]
MEILPVEVNYLIFDRLDDKSLLSLSYINKYSPKVLAGYKGGNKTLNKIINHIFFDSNINSDTLNLFELQKLMCERYVPLLSYIISCYNMSKYKEDNISNTERFKIEYNVKNMIKDLLKHTVNPYYVYKLCYGIIDIQEGDISTYMNNLLQRVSSSFKNGGCIHEDINICIKYFINKECYGKLYNFIFGNVIGHGFFEYYYNLYPTQMFSILVIGWTDENYTKSKDLLKTLIKIMVASVSRISLWDIDENILYKLSMVPLLTLVLPYISGLSEQEVFDICTYKRATNVNKLIERHIFSMSKDYTKIMELLQKSEYYDEYNSIKYETEDGIEDNVDNKDDIEQREILNYYNSRDDSKLEKMIKNDDVDKFLDIYYNLNMSNIDRMLRKYLPVNILIMLSSMDVKVCYSLTDEELLEFGMDRVSILIENGIINVT